MTRKSIETITVHRRRYSRDVICPTKVIRKENHCLVAIIMDNRIVFLTMLKLGYTFVLNFSPIVTYVSSD